MSDAPAAAQCDSAVTGLRPSSLALRVRTRTGSGSYLAMELKKHPYGVATVGKRAVQPKAAISKGNDMTRTPAARMRGGVRVKGVRVVSPDVPGFR
ncbi:hypothetical protein [Arthrobacter rhizosphaerae]|uniref:hypothetical protein n=1 Tax=Arthrobacter rhizosphaerae TaxID=2855490 RepID=UPI001FF3FBB5|nr:hypothetical protein [Arthrobacter rhizosphaerae]